MNMTAWWARRRSIKRIRHALTTDLHHVPAVHPVFTPEHINPGCREHWAPAIPAQEIADMMYEHFQRWPQDHARLQPLIKAGFLHYFPGKDGDVFRNMVWPPPLYDFTSGLGQP